MAAGIYFPNKQLFVVVSLWKEALVLSFYRSYSKNNHRVERHYGTLDILLNPP